MVKATAGSAMLKRIEQERALKGTVSLTSLFQKQVSRLLSAPLGDRTNVKCFRPLCFIYARTRVSLILMGTRHPRRTRRAAAARRRAPRLQETGAQ